MTLIPVAEARARTGRKEQSSFSKLIRLLESKTGIVIIRIRGLVDWDSMQAALLEYSRQKGGK